MSYTANFGIDPKLRIIPAVIRNEKNDALCPDSPTNIHFLILNYTAEGKIIATGERLTCQACGQPIKQQGARWVLNRYIINEADEIDDLL